ncbi:MAG: DUF6457 domain-containing protein [Gaiellaceae bacterium]
MSEWLDKAGRRLAEAAGDDPAGDGLSAADVETLLDLAGVAAHDSGERTNAPLVCYLLGLARGRHPELGLGHLAATAGGSEGG